MSAQTTAEQPYMIPSPDQPNHITRTAWVAPGCAYGAWVYLAAGGEDLTGTQITETPLMEGISGVLFTTAPEAATISPEDP